MQSQRNAIKDNDDVKLLLARIRKMQNTVNIGIKTSTKDIIDKRKLDISIGNKIQK